MHPFPTKYSRTTLFRTYMFLCVCEYVSVMFVWLSASILSNAPAVSERYRIYHTHQWRQHGDMTEWCRSALIYLCDTIEKHIYNIFNCSVHWTFRTPWTTAKIEEIAARTEHPVEILCSVGLNNHIIWIYSCYVIV